MEKTHHHGVIYFLSPYQPGDIYELKALRSARFTTSFSILFYCLVRLILKGYCCNMITKLTVLADVDLMFGILAISLQVNDRFIKFNKSMTILLNSNS